MFVLAGGGKERLVKLASENRIDLNKIKMK